MATDRADSASRRTQNPIAAAAAAADVLVLSADPKFVQAVRKAVGDVRVWHAADATQAADLLVGTECGVLLLDANTEGSLTTVLAARLAEQFPEMALIVVGSRDDEAALSRLISSGKVYRFLHTPISHERVRNFVDAGLRRHQTARRAVTGAPVTAKTHVPVRWSWLALVAAVLLVVTLGIWWSLHAREHHEERELASDPASQAVIAAKPAPVSAPPVTRITRPTQAAPLAAPATATATATATAPATTIATSPAQPAPPKVAVARAAPEPTAVPAAPERSAYEQRRLEQRMAGLLTQARQRLEDDLLITPAGDSAKDKLLAARELDPGDATLRAALVELRAALLQHARKATTQGLYVEASRWLDAVGELQPADPELAAARSLLEATRLQAAADIQAARAQQQVAQERRLEETLREQQQRAAPAMAVIAESRLRRKHYQAPAYPAAARAKGVEGYVDLRYTVTAAGATENVEIVAGSPAGVFDDVVRTAVLGWRYEPPLVNGTPTAQRVTVRLRFQLDH